MKTKLINFLKSKKWIYYIFFSVVSSILKVVGAFIKSDRKEILFVCYGGRKYGDNVRPIYEYMLNDDRFNKWTFVWAFRNPDQFELKDSKRSIKCRIDTIDFLLHAYKAQCWVTNTSVQRGLNFKNKNTFYVNTFHSIAIKLIQQDVKDKDTFKPPIESFDLVCAGCEYDYKFLPSAFKIDPSKVKITGYPRNDIMFQRSCEEVRRNICKKYEIDMNKRIILYAPTYRDYVKKSDGAFDFKQTLSSEKFNRLLGRDNVMMVRIHEAIEDDANLNFIDVSTYPDVEDLLMTADVLITDYSGILFDFSLLDKPIILYPYDLKKYEKSRGLYVNYETFFPFKICLSENELYDLLENLEYEAESLITRNFRNKVGLSRELATGRVVEEINRVINYKD